jgi:hypothetical protein
MLDSSLRSAGAAAVAAQSRSEIINAEHRIGSLKRWSVSNRGDSNPLAQK